MTTTMVSAQTRLDNAILAAEQTDAEVERLCDIVERAADALKKARQTKRAAQKELDEAAKAAKAAAAAPRRAVRTPAPGALTAQPRYSGRIDQGVSAHHASINVPPGSTYREEADQDTDEPQSDYSDEESEDYSDSEESDDEEDDEEEGEAGGFDMGNEALEQIRYRLDTAKIDPNSPDGTKILDELLVRLQDSKEEVISAHIVNELIDELLFDTEGQEPPQEVTNSATAEKIKRKPPPQNSEQHPRIRINRGGKLLGWYQGQLDERGYAREGQGSMYYDAGHECHGTWENDEMVGRGMYQCLLIP